MSFTLQDAKDDDFRLNAWNWGVLHHLVVRAAILPDQVWEPARYNAGAELDTEQIGVLADFLEQSLLPRLQPGERMYHDGSVTDEPDDGTFYREEGEMWKNYSLHHSVLIGVIAFLRQAEAPVQVF